MSVRPAETADLAPLARLWWQGWRDAHLPIVPKALAARRTLDSFIDRMAVSLVQVRAVGPVGAPLGFYMIKGDELHQLYVAEEARGDGIATLLLVDAEVRLLGAGITMPWLACAIGNARAARFYEKSGWTLARTEIVPTEIPAGWFPLKVWRYEKQLPQTSAWAAYPIGRLEGRLTAPQGLTEARSYRPRDYSETDDIPWGRRAGDRVGSRQV